MIFDLITKDTLADLDPFLIKIGATGLNREREAWVWIMDMIRAGEQNALIPVERDETGAIITAALCYSVDAAFGSKKSMVPYWVLGLTRSWSSTPISPRHNNLFGPVIRHFEAQGMFTFFMCRLVSKTMTYKNSDAHFSKAQLRMGIDRYDCRLEKLLDHPSEAQGLPLLYHIFTHSMWDPTKRKAAIIRHDLKVDER